MIKRTPTLIYSYGKYISERSGVEYFCAPEILTTWEIDIADRIEICVSDEFVDEEFSIYSHRRCSYNGGEKWLNRVVADHRQYCLGDLFDLL